MATSLVDADSVLVLDVGAITTRALLFDVVDGRYRFIAAGNAPTTAGAPFRNISEGIRMALDQLDDITGRPMIGSDQRLITPTRSTGAGVDKCVACLAVGAPLKAVVVGLLEDISVESAIRLANSTYAQVVDRFTLNDRRKQTARIDSILRLRPDLVIVAGGTENGASHSVLNLLESVGIACHLMPAGAKPEILFVGNQALQKDVENLIGSTAPVSFAPNIRPTLEVEQLGPAQVRLAEIYRNIRMGNMLGVADLDSWTNGNTLPYASAFSRTIRFLSEIMDTSGVLGVNISPAGTVVAAGFSGELSQNVYTDLGFGENLPQLLQQCPVEEITRWLTISAGAQRVKDYLYNKSLRPYTVAETAEELAIEQAALRQVLSMSVQRASSTFPASVFKNGPAMLPFFEPIILSGSSVTNSLSKPQALLLALNGLQPTGVTTIVLDQNDLTAPLGAIAPANNILPIHLLESSNFNVLAMVVSVLGNAKYGTPAVKVKITYEAGNQSTFEVKFGAMEVIPLPYGQRAKLEVQPLGRFDIGRGPGVRSGINVSGGALGIVIDARGRPIRLPAEPDRRRELLKKWLWTFGG